MRTAALMVILAGSAFAQPPGGPQLVGGTWRLSFDDVAYGRPIQLGATTFSTVVGYFISTDGTIAPGFVGQRASGTPANVVTYTLLWDRSINDIPGARQGVYVYFGTLAADGKSITGTYGLSPSQTVGGWTAKLSVPAAAPVPATAPTSPTFAACTAMVQLVDIITLQLSNLQCLVGPSGAGTAKPQQFFQDAGVVTATGTYEQ